jgi:hypothetical protein
MVPPVRPTSARLDTATICQLQCPLCPTEVDGRAVIGKGVMRFEDFQRFVARNPQLRRLELGNSGEALLNKQLPEMLAYAHSRGVRTRLNQGVNLNAASDTLLETLVRSQTEVVRVSIDGITQGSYEKYRAGGDLSSVIGHIKAINRWKRHYRSEYPHLIFQFIVFGHNEEELPKARLLARMLNMEFQVRLNRHPEVFALGNAERLREQLGYADREEFAAVEGKHYCSRACFDLWFSPQINWDGKLLGCSRNKWVSYAEEVFEEDLDFLMNGEALNHTRAVVTGNAEPRDDTPCRFCDVYQFMQRSGSWVGNSAPQCQEP